MRSTFSILAMISAVPALADGTRQLDTHEHGVGALSIAIEGTTVAMELLAPGADIVGFEYVAESEEDRMAVDSAVAKLAAPLNLFVIPDAAECSVTQASASLKSEEDHDDHDDHEEAKHDDHDDHEEHAEHDDHADEAMHTEFHAESTLTCANPNGLTEISFAYFDAFENARELDVQIITDSGAQAFEVTRDDPVLDLRSLF